MMLYPVRCENGRDTLFIYLLFAQKRLSNPTRSLCAINPFHFTKRNHLLESINDDLVSWLGLG
jgi:hypothetical protein